MAHITRRTAIQGLAGAGLAPLIQTGCFLDPELIGHRYLLWFFYGATKADYLAAQTQPFPDSDPTDKTNEDVSKILQKLGSGGAKSAPRRHQGSDRGHVATDRR